MTRAWIGLACAVVLLVTVPARADETVRHTVQPGETCAGIATRYYGDARLVDLIHGANAGMGPPPHRLVPGQVLTLPPKTPLAVGPDAHLTRLKNDVEVRAPEPRPGKPNDPLYRGNRVGTKEQASADVTFRDETQVKLGENTLIVVLGDENARALRVDATATLVTGSLRARLAELAGKDADRARITTDSGAVALKSGEAKVSVDDAKTTRLAVHRGASSLTAQKRTVDVGDGFGSKAAVGAPPTPPRPLPEAPSFTRDTALVLGTTSRTELAFALTEAAAPGSGAPAAARWHAQVARDPGFDDLVLDAVFPASAGRIEIKDAPVGRYFARVSAIDADEFEGKWSGVGSALVAVITTSDLPRRASRLDVAPGDVRCTLAGDTAAVAVVDRKTAQRLLCRDTGGAPGRPAAEETFALPARPLGAVSARLAVVERHGQEGTVRIALEETGGAPSDEEVVIERSDGIVVGPLTRVADGAYLASATFRPSPSARVWLRIAGEATVETNTVPLAAPPPPLRLELLASARGLRERAQLGFGGALGARLAIPREGVDVLTQAEAIYEHLPTSTVTIAESVGRGEVDAHVAGGQIGLGVRAARREATWAPYFVVGPGLTSAFTRVEVRGVTRTARSIGPAIAASAGVELRLDGRWAVFAELAARAVVPTSISGAATVDATALGLAIGARVAP